MDLWIFIRKEGLLSIISLILFIIGLAFYYRIILRSRRDLHKGLILCFIAMLLFIVMQIFDFLCQYRQSDFCLNWMYPYGLEIVKVSFAVLLLIGFWYLQKTVKQADGELFIKEKKSKKE